LYCPPGLDFLDDGLHENQKMMRPIVAFLMLKKKSSERLLETDHRSSPIFWGGETDYKKLSYCLGRRDGLQKAFLSSVEV
jgi:hypothetical protein